MFSTLNWHGVGVPIYVPLASLKKGGNLISQSDRRPGQIDNMPSIYIWSNKHSQTLVFEQSRKKMAKTQQSFLHCHPGGATGSRTHDACHVFCFY